MKEDLNGAKTQLTRAAKILNDFANGRVFKEINLGQRTVTRQKSKKATSYLEVKEGETTLVVEVYEK